MYRKTRIFVAGVLGMFYCCGSHAAVKRPVTPSDCVNVRYLLSNNAGESSLQLNPQATRVAYLVKSPNIALNQNDIQLYVKDISPSSSIAPRLLLTGVEVSQLVWLEDGRHVTVLAKNQGLVSVVEIDTDSGELSVLAKTDSDIKEYSIDSRGSVVVFSTEESKDQPSGSFGPKAQDSASGYRIAFEDAANAFFYRRRLYVTRRSTDKTWTAPQPLVLRSPFSRKLLTTFPYLVSMHLSLSPDATSLLINYVDEDEQLPPNWEANAYVKLLRANGFPGILPTLLVSLADGSAKLAIQSPWISNTPLWAKDSRAFAVAAISPIGSPWDESDQKNHRIGSEGAHLFVVDRHTGKADLVIARMADGGRQPLDWKRNGTLVLRTSADTVSDLAPDGEGWKVNTTLHIPLVEAYRFSALTSDGETVVGDYQNAATAPEIFLFRRGQESVQVLARLNPQIDDLSLAPMQQIQWTTSTGYAVEGYLFAPPEYQKGIRYPLVIQTKPDEGQFVCDTGQNHYPSFAPQPMANAGMMYLIRTIPTSWTQKDEEDHYPKSYPGGVGEAAFQADIWASAVKSLDRLGMIDADRVGIIGFSRSGWYTSFALTHSSIRYRAATITDNVEYGLAEYWLLRRAAILRGSDTIYGGPPFGATLKNWLDYSISFNVDKIHTPVLMEEMGYEVAYNNVQAPPLNLAMHWDLFVGLNRLKRPVELYFYPNEVHQPDHPQARLATLQRNLDWYRFWLEDYERPSPEDPEQYVRWRRLREMQKKNGDNLTQETPF
jgi:dipeptidyl aminopeptidase/acylaminoacyl peptidase